MNILPLFSTPIYQDQLDVEVDLRFLDSLDRYTLNEVDQVYSFSNHQVLNLESLAHLRDRIMQSVNEYLYDVIAFDKSAKVSIVSSWVNAHLGLGGLDFHTHHNSMFSGVYYLEAEKGASPLVFEAPPGIPSYCTQTISPPLDHDNLYNARRVEVEANTGKLIRFPSHVIHGVSSNPYVGRKAISFNLFLDGEFLYDTSSVSIKTSPVSRERLSEHLSDNPITA